MPAFDTRMYKLDEPGLYTIQLQYQYTGGITPAGVFADHLDSNELTFEIR
jgi:hypothetical protein